MSIVLVVNSGRSAGGAVGERDGGEAGRRGAASSADSVAAVRAAGAGRAVAGGVAVRYPASSSIRDFEITVGIT